MTTKSDRIKILSENYALGMISGRYYQKQRLALQRIATVSYADDMEIEAPKPERTVDNRVAFYAKYRRYIGLTPSLIHRILTSK